MYNNITVQLKIWTYAGNLFIVAKVCVEPAILLGWNDYRRMVQECSIDSPEQHSSSSFEFRVLLTGCFTKSWEYSLLFYFTHSGGDCMPSHLYQMTRISPSKLYCMGHLFYTLSPLRKAGVSLERTALFGNKEMKLKIMRSCSVSGSPPLSFYVWISNRSSYGMLHLVLTLSLLRQCVRYAR